MPFGIKFAPEEFQRRHHKFLEGLVNIAVIHDDVITFGFSDSMEEAPFHMTVLSNHFLTDAVDEA